MLIIYPHLLGVLPRGCKMAMSKKQLAAGMKRTRLSLEEKIEVLNYVKDHPKKSCRDISEQFKIGKTAASNILRDSKKLRKEYLKAINYCEHLLL